MRLRVLFMLLGGVLVAATFTFPLWQPLVMHQVAAPQDVFPGLAPQFQASFLSLPPEQQRAYFALATQAPDKAVAMVAAALGPRVQLSPTDQAMPEMNSPVTIGGGTFQQIDAVRRAQGTVNIYQQADNSLVMRFEDFNMPTGPDVRVYLSAATTPVTFEQMHTNNLDPVEIGPLKSSIGSQNYQVPALDLTQYQSVVLYSPQLDLVYSYAPLFVRH